MEIRTNSVFYFEDSASDREQFGSCMVNQGYKLEEYDNAYAAIQAIINEGRRYCPAVAVLDYRDIGYKPPDQAGIDICRQLKKKWPQLPVIFLTTLGEDYRISALEIGMNHFITKGKTNTLSHLMAHLRVCAKQHLDDVNRLRLNENPGLPVVTRVYDELVYYVTEDTYSWKNERLELGEQTAKVLNALLTHKNEKLTSLFIADYANISYGNEEELLNEIQIQCRRLEKEIEPLEMLEEDQDYQMNIEEKRKLVDLTEKHDAKEQEFEKIENGDMDIFKERVCDSIKKEISKIRIAIKEAEAKSQGISVKNLEEKVRNGEINRNHYDYIKTVRGSLDKRGYRWCTRIGN